MRKIVVAMALCAVSVVSARAVFAADARFPQRAKIYSTFMVRAFDSCTPSILSVISQPTLPASGCQAAISDDVPPTDPLGATMRWAKLTVRRFRPGPGNGRVTIVGKGFQSGQRVKVRLTLRTTRSGIQIKHPPAVNQSVTFADTTIDCGNVSAGCFVARATGALGGKQDLADCLTQNGEPTGLGGENIAIIAASLVNCDTGNTIAVPGTLNQ
jgi:hypothetical protein